MQATAETRALAAALCALWGATFVAQRIALEVARPLWVGGGRAAIAAVLLLPLAGGLRRLGPRGLAVVLVLGVANQTAFIGFQAAGLRTVGAGAGAAIVYLQPVLVVLGAAAFLGERLSARRVVGALVGFAGVAIVGLHQASEASVAGVLLLMGAATAWAIGALVTSAAREPVMPLLAGQHLVGAPLLLVGALLTEPLPPLSARFALPVLFAGAFGSALAWGLWSVLLRRGEAGVVSTWLFAVPMLAAVLGVVLLGEPLSAELGVGIALVAVAVRLAAAPQRQRSPSIR